MHKHPHPRQITSVKFPQVGKYFRAMHEKEERRLSGNADATAPNAAGAAADGAAAGSHSGLIDDFEGDMFGIFVTKGRGAHCYSTERHNVTVY